MKLAAIFYFAILHLSVAVSIGNENRTTATPKQDEPYEEAYISNIEDYDDDMINMLVEDGVINGPSDGYALDKYDMTDEDDFGELLEAHVSRKKRDVEALEELIQPRVSRKKRDVTISKRDAHGHDTPTSSHENVDGCPPYFVQCMSKCYFFSNFIYKYDDARKACQASGADLVAIESVQEDLFLTKKLKLFTKTAKKLKQGGPKAVKKSSGFRFDAIVRAMKARGLAHALPAHLRHMAKNDQPSEDLPNGWWTSARTALPYVNRHSPQEWVWNRPIRRLAILAGIQAATLRLIFHVWPCGAGLRIWSGRPLLVTHYWDWHVRRTFPTDGQVIYEDLHSLLKVWKPWLPNWITRSPLTF